MGLLWWKKPQPFEEFVGYMDSIRSNDVLLLKTVQRANSLGLQGKVVKVIEKRNVITGNPMLSSIWLMGESE